MAINVKELKKWLDICNDDDNVIIEYNCNDDWYNYYGTIKEIDFDGEDIVLRVNN